MSLPDDLDESDKARTALHQRDLTLAVARSAQLSCGTLPVASDMARSAIFRRSFPDGNGIDDLALRVSVNARRAVERPDLSPLGAKVA